MAIWEGFVKVLELVLRFFYNPASVGVPFESPVQNAGLAIIFFTIAFKLVLLPLTASQLRSSREMARLQPKVRELQKKYAKDREKLNQEMMALYKEHGVNPMAGCLPSLLQLPIFFGVYWAILNVTRALSVPGLLGGLAGLNGLAHLGLGTVPSPEIIQSVLRPDSWANEAFLWLNSMGKPDPLHILPILAGVLQLAQQKMMTQRNADPQQSAMNNAMMFMPLLIVFIGWSFPAGPVLYWVTQSLVSIVQQYFTSGWGSLKDWLPFLPERRPAPAKPKKAAAPSAGEEDARPRGLFWRAMDRLGNLSRQAAEREGLASPPPNEPTPREGSPSRVPPTPEKRRSQR